MRSFCKRLLFVMVSVIFCLLFVFFHNLNKFDDDNINIYISTSSVEEDKQKEDNKNQSIEEDKQKDDSKNQSVEEDKQKDDSKNQSVEEDKQKEDNKNQPVEEDKQKDDNKNQKDDFSNCAMLGNSYMYGFDIYSVLPKIDCFYLVGLNVKTVFEKSMINSDIPIIDELDNNKKYKNIFLMFGENELGWPNEKAFFEEYADVIDTVKKYQPDANIYIQSMLPVSKNVSQKNKDGVNNENIRERNEGLKNLAKEKNIEYIDVYSIMVDKDGNLPEDAATDGIHPDIEYYKKWANYIIEII